MTRLLPAGRAVFALALLAGCTVGRNFEQPKADAPQAWTDPAAKGAGVPGASRAIPQSDPDPRWWTGFRDPKLTSLIERAVRGNIDLQQAVYRILQARANEAATAAAGLPALNASGSYTRQQLGLKGILQSSGALSRLSGSSDGGGGPGGLSNGTVERLTGPIDLFQAGFDASWELDLFGRVRRGVEAQAAEVQAQIESRNDALVSLEAEVAQSYVRLRGSQAQAEMARENIRAETDIVNLTRRRQAQGLVTELDVLNATSQLRSGEADLPQYEQQAIAASNRLAVLMGLPPGALDAELTPATPVPPLPQEIAIGFPASLARRRPDIRQAEAALHAATAQTGVAIAELFPDVTLTGSVGTRSDRAKYLARWASLFYSFGPAVSIPIFEGGRLRANIELTRAQEAEAALQYRKTVLNALEEVENALASYRTEQGRRLSLQQSLQSAELSLTLARERYEHGLSSFLDVLNSERVVVTTRQQLIQSTVLATNDLVALYKALGGGWQDDPDAASRGATPPELPPVGTIGNSGVTPAQPIVSETKRSGWFSRLFDVGWP